MSDPAHRLAAGEPAARSDLPPLRLHHFFAWTAVSAGVLATNSAFDGGVFERVAPWWTLTWLPSVLWYSLALTCCGFGLYWRRRGLRFPSQPGHGMLLVGGLGYIFWLGLSLLVLALFGRDKFTARFEDSPWLESVSNVYLLFVIASNLWFAWWTRRRGDGKCFLCSRQWLPAIIISPEFWTLR